MFKKGDKVRISPAWARNVGIIKDAKEEADFNALVIEINPTRDESLVAIQEGPRQGATYAVPHHQMIHGWAERRPAMNQLAMVMKQYAEDPAIQRRDRILAALFGYPQEQPQSSPTRAKYKWTRKTIHVWELFFSATTSASEPDELKRIRLVNNGDRYGIPETEGDLFDVFPGVDLSIPENNHNWRYVPGGSSFEIAIRSVKTGREWLYRAIDDYLIGASIYLKDQALVISGFEVVDLD